MNESTSVKVVWSRTYKVSRRPGACESTTTTRESFPLSWTNTRVGTDNPYWRTQVAQGVDATTNFSGYRQTTHPGGSGYVRLSFGPPIQFPACSIKEQELTGDIVGLPLGHNSPLMDPATSLNKAKQAVVQQAMQSIRPIMGGVVLGELRKTLGSIRSPAVALRNLIRSYLGELKKIPGTLSSQTRRRMLTNAYLEATFAWNPLMYDIRGGIEALRRFSAERDFDIKKVVGYGKVVGTSAPIFGVDQVGNIVLRYQDLTTRTIQDRIVCGFKIQAQQTGSGIFEDFGLLPKDWLPTAWELLPYSFLIDYFTNIGTIIDAWSSINANLAFAVLSHRDIMVTRRTNVKLDTSSAGSLLTSSFIRPVKPGLKSKSVSRQRITNLVPSLEFRLPGFGTKQALNVAFLAHARANAVSFY